MKFQNLKFIIQNYKGVALIAVLAILVVLTILAASFSAMMDLELKQSNEQQNSFQLDMLNEAGLEHAKTLMMAASNVGQASSLSREKFTKWFYIKDAKGKVAGRYRIKIEDEAGKANINRARLPKNSKGFGWDTGEVNLPKALGVPPEIAKRVIKYRYGPNLLPGGRGDDDQNNVMLMADGIDNNANGIVDEEDEGINDPGEYRSEALAGDDRKFSTINEAVSILLDTKKKLPSSTISKLRNLIPERATIYSIDEIGSSTLKTEIPSDINSITARECRKLITKANEKKTFIPGGQKRAQLTANIVDYRDENHVLSTLGSTYGVEAICFNEVMANEESVTHDLVYARIPAAANDSGFWIDNFGMTDDKRCIYCVDTFFGCIPDSPTMESKRFQVLDPRQAWHIDSDDINRGKLEKKGNNWKIKFPKAIGKNGKSLNEEDLTLYLHEKGADEKPENIKPGNKNFLEWPKKEKLDPWTGYDTQFGSVKDGSDEKFINYCNAALEVMEKVGIKTDGKRPEMQNNYFENSLVCIYGWQKSSSENPPSLGIFKIIESDADSITFENENNYSPNEIHSFKHLFEKNMAIDDYDLSVSINSWANSRSYAYLPKANQTYLIRSRRPRAGNYFKIVFGRPPYNQYGEGNLKGYPDRLGVSGRIGGGWAEDKNFKKRKWVYNNGKPVRTKNGGWIDLLVTSPPEVSCEDKIGQVLFYIRMEAPEVTEMYNASATPVSLANWRVICNTGSEATEIGKIRNTSYYDKILKKSVSTDNPVVEPGGHFYLVNDTKLFDYWYGSGNGKWGSSPKEEVPVFQMDEENWGVTYKIKKAKIRMDLGGLVITPKGLNMDAHEVFKTETIKFIDKKNENNPKSLNNFFTYVVGDKDRNSTLAKDQFFTWSVTDIKYVKSAKIMILGLPHAGGIVSLTLKNEYEQICARTIDYGKVESEEIGKSSEKIDPTKNTWIKRKKHTIAGRNKDALNRAMRTRRGETYFIKNGPYGSVGELRHVSTGNNFERHGGQKGDISKGLESIGAIADVASCSQVRLESASGNVVRKGWKEAKDEVINSSLKTITCKNGNFKVDKWKGQSIKFLTGALRGEKFVIIANSKNVITLAEKKKTGSPYSAPGRKLCKPNKGDKFSLGPGYASAFCYTRKGGESGGWTWKNALPNVGQASRLTMSEANQNLYIYGLNDAIDTTEFFEENNNASLDVDVWNYKTQKFDSLCKKKKYGKQDSFNAGKISPKHISESGDFRIQLTSHDIAEKELENDSDEARIDTGGRQTGIAWFNYAVITPVSVPARVNINTAPARLLASLPGITSKLANNITDGIGTVGKKNLKPYRNLGDIMKVKGMTPEIFERCANILTVNSSIFTVEVEAETVSCQRTGRSGSKCEHPNETVTGSRSKRFIIKNNNNSFKILEKY